ncbi:hypothetical protein JCM5353_006590 [Sporobolomyces roseus]
MSTSSSTSPPSPLGECVVCGKESLTRCSSCAKGGVEWMFFCSTEHQKLIWSLHKRVCGDLFKWPALKPRERDEINELGTKPTTGVNGTVTTWCEHIMGGPALERVPIARRQKAMEDGFKYLTGTLVEGGQACLDNQSLLCEHRGTAFTVKLNSGPFLNNSIYYRDQQKFIEADPLGFLAYLETGHTELRQDTLSEFSRTSWYSDLHHRMLILVGLQISDKRSILAEDRKAIEAQMDWFHDALHKVIELARGPIRESQPEIAQIILDLYLPGFLKTVGVVFSSEEEVNSTEVWKRMKEGGKNRPLGVMAETDEGELKVLVDRKRGTQDV